MPTCPIFLVDDVTDAFYRRLSHTHAAKAMTAMIPMGSSAELSAVIAVAIARTKISTAITGRTQRRIS